MSSGIRSGLLAAGLAALVLVPAPAAAQHGVGLRHVGFADPVIGAPVRVPALLPDRPVGTARPRASRVAPRPRDWVDRKRWGFAIPGMLAGNVIPMVFNESLQSWKEISRTSAHTWGLSWNPFTQWEWDDNHFFNNQLFHPIQGNFYFTAARSNGFNYWWSMLFAGAGSYLWECCGERRIGAYNDWWNTTLGGAALGEMLYRGSSLLLDNEERGIDRYALELLTLPLVGARFVSRGLYGQWRYGPNPSTRTPLDGWGVSFGSGLRTTGGAPHAFFDVALRYGSPFNAGPPFHFFEANAQINGRDQPIGLVQVYAHLADRRLLGHLAGDGGGVTLRGIVSQGYDYLDSSPELEPEVGYRYGGQSVGLGASLLARSDTLEVWKLRADLGLDGVLIGAVNSHDAVWRGTYVAERNREYDFGRGVGLRVEATGDWADVLGASVSYRKTRLWVLNGSNVDSLLFSRCSTGDHTCFSESAVYRSSHWVDAATASVKLGLDELLECITGFRPVLWAEPWYVGVDWLWFKKRSVYTNPRYDNDVGSTHQWRFMVSWTRTKRIRRGNP